MGGRGTFASGHSVPYTYLTVDKIEGRKVLNGKDGKHNLPAEAHSSKAYIRLKPDGTFHEMRFYNKDHRLVREIAYHPKSKLNGNNRKDSILHVHDYPIPGDFQSRTTRLLTTNEYMNVKKYLKGIPKNARR